MDERELRHRIERSQQELDYWRERADQMRSVLDRLETDYLTHRTDCCLVRQRRLRVVIAQAQAAVASLENAGADWLQPESSTTSSGRSSPTESDALLTQPHHSSIVSAAADYSRNVRRAAFLSQLKSMTRADLESALSRFEAKTRHQRDFYNAIRDRFATLANEYDELQQQACCLRICLACGCNKRLERIIRTTLDRPGRLVDV